MTTLTTARTPRRSGRSRPPARRAGARSTRRWKITSIQTGPPPTACPAWCTETEHMPDCDGSVVHGTEMRTVDIVGVGTQRPHEVRAGVTLIVGPARDSALTIDLDAEQCALTPQYALEVADMLTDLAILALGVDNGPTGRSGDWWRGYAVGLTDGSGSAERAIQEAAHPARTLVRRTFSRVMPRRHGASA
jgi:hypothetical protein